MAERIVLKHSMSAVQAAYCGSTLEQDFHADASYFAQPFAPEEQRVKLLQAQVEHCESSAECFHGSAKYCAS